MSEVLDLLSQEGNGLRDYGLRSTVLSLLMAFVIGQFVAWVYVWTHRGVSYSRAFAQSLVLLTMVVALVMFVIGDSIITAFGLIGALAIIRFRNVLKDTRDTAFVFFVLVLGMAVGSRRYLTAVVGALVLMAAVAYLYLTAFGSRGRYDGHLSFRVESDELGDALTAVLHRFCRLTRQVSMHMGGGDVEFVYEVRLRDRQRAAEFLAAVREAPRVDGVSLMLRDELAEL
jgi:hypothetical protein